jgi:hypothetical protein
MYNLKKMTLSISPDSTRQLGYFNDREFAPSTLPTEEIPTYNLDVKIIAIANYLRQRLDKPLRINSAGRTPKKNASITGAAKGSYHLILHNRPVQALDLEPILQNKIALDEFKNVILENSSILKIMGLKGVGFYKGFVHLDVGGSRVHCWGLTSSQKSVLLDTRNPLLEFFEYLNNFTK